MNTVVLTSRQPVVFDTGVPADRDAPTRGCRRPTLPAGELAGSFLVAVR